VFEPEDVARNRITELFRRKKPEVLGGDLVLGDADGESLLLEDLFASPDAGPPCGTRKRLLLGIARYPAESRDATIEWFKKKKVDHHSA
jgi:hypothetical protein